MISIEYISVLGQLNFLKKFFSIFSSEIIGEKEGEDAKSIQNKVLKESEKLKNIDGVISDKSVNRRHKKRRIHLVTKPSDVWLHRDGRVHEISFLDPQDSTEKLSDGKTYTYSTIILKYS